MHQLFDWNLYGTLVRRERLNRGMKTPSELSREIQRCTRQQISKDVLYRIEQNRQDPTAQQFLAINLTLFGKLFPEQRADISACLCAEWRFYQNEEQPPLHWRIENINAAYEQCGFVSDEGDKCVFDSDVPGDVNSNAYLDYESYIPKEQRRKIHVDGEEAGETIALLGDVYILI